LIQVQLTHKKVAIRSLTKTCASTAQCANMQKYSHTHEWNTDKQLQTPNIDGNVHDQDQFVTFTNQVEKLNFAELSIISPSAR